MKLWSGIKHEEENMARQKIPGNRIRMHFRKNIFIPMNPVKRYRRCGLYGTKETSSHTLPAFEH